MRRLPVVLVAMLTLGSAAGCGAESRELGPLAAEPEDRRSQTYGADPDRPETAEIGPLTCADGMVSRSVGPGISGPTEPEVALAALEPWLADGAQPEAIPADESWSAVVDGRVVAVAYPEQEGDGGWVVDQVVTCGEPSTGPAPIDGTLDCAGDTSWGQTGSIDPEAQGLATAADAVEQVLDGYADRLGGKVVMVDPNRGSVVVQSREVVTATAFELDDDRGWVIDSVSGCEGTGP